MPLVLTRTPRAIGKLHLALPPVEVSTDTDRRKFARPVPAPLADLQKGINTTTWSLAAR